MATTTRAALEQFLAMPETEPASELIDGEVIQKMAPSLYHSSLVLELGMLLRTYLRTTREGRLIPNSGTSRRRRSESSFPTSP